MPNNKVGEKGRVIKRGWEVGHRKGYKGLPVIEEIFERRGAAAYAAGAEARKEIKQKCHDWVVARLDAK